MVKLEDGSQNFNNRFKTEENEIQWNGKLKYVKQIGENVEWNDPKPLKLSEWNNNAIYVNKMFGTMLKYNWIHFVDSSRILQRWV